MVDWFVGQKVVCINTDYKYETGGEHIKSLRLNQIYSIREILEYPFNYPEKKNSLCLRLNELVFPKKVRSLGVEFNEEPVFGVWRFRPLVESKNDISVFQEILNKVSKAEVLPLY